MFGFLTFATVMAFTPGPNTLMAMNEGQQKGFRGGGRFNLGVLVGMLGIGLLSAVFATWFKQFPPLITGLKIVGTGYLLWLAYHILTSKSNDRVTTSNQPFITAVLLQTTNVKVYLCFITVVTTFTVTGWWGRLPVKLALLIGLGVLGTLAWTLAGQLIQHFYQRHLQLVNAIIAGLLAYSAYDLW